MPSGRIKTLFWKQLKFVDSFQIMLRINWRMVKISLCWVSADARVLENKSPELQNVSWCSNFSIWNGFVSIFRAPFSIRKYIFEPTPKRQKYLPNIRWYFCDLPRLIIFIYRPLSIFRIPCFHCLSVVLNIKICRICPLLENCLLFFVEKFFKKENILFSWVFFLFLILPMTRRLRVCRIVGLLYYTYVWGVTAVRKPEVAGSSPGVGHILYTLLEIRQHIIIFY